MLLFKKFKKKYMQVKFKKIHPFAVLPTYAKPGDAGLDITATGIKHTDEETVTYSTGLAVEIPPGHVGLIFPRSSIRDYNLMLSNSVGVIDSGYRGEIVLTFRRTGNGASYDAGDRVGQMIIIPYPTVEPVWADELTITQREDGGFGSTGK